MAFKKEDIDLEIDTLLEGLLTIKQDFRELKKVCDERFNKNKKPEPSSYKPTDAPKIDVDKVKLLMKKYNIRDRHSCKNVVFNDVKKELKDYLNKPETKAKINKARQEITKEYGEKPNFRFVCRWFEEDIIEIIDGSQAARIELSFIIDHLVDFVDNKYGDILLYFKMGVGGGSGDEGCVYLDY